MLGEAHLIDVALRTIGYLLSAARWSGPADEIPAEKEAACAPCPSFNYSVAAEACPAGGGWGGPLLGAAVVASGLAAVAAGRWLVCGHARVAADSSETAGARARRRRLHGGRGVVG